MGTEGVNIQKVLKIVSGTSRKTISVLRTPLPAAVCTEEGSFHSVCRTLIEGTMSSANPSYIRWEMRAPA